MLEAFSVITTSFIALVGTGRCWFCRLRILSWLGIRTASLIHAFFDTGLLSEFASLAITLVLALFKHTIALIFWIRCRSNSWLLATISIGEALYETFFKVFDPLGVAALTTRLLDLLTLIFGLLCWFWTIFTVSLMLLDAPLLTIFDLTFTTRFGALFSAFFLDPM